MVVRLGVWSLVFWAVSSVAASPGVDPDRLDPVVPFAHRPSDLANCMAELRHINAVTGLRRFFICAPRFNRVMYGPFPDDLYARIGEDVAAYKKGLADTDIEISWWCAPSIRYVSNHAPVVDAAGHTSCDNKKCPLDPAFAADYVAKICAVAQHRPAFICIEDDYTLAWGRGLDGFGACFCERHMKAFSARYGKSLTAGEIVAAFKDQTPVNLPIRKAFADGIRDSLVQLARQVREGIDRIDPSIRTVLCQPGGADKDGDSTEAVARAFAGATRPALRPFGACYSAETTPAGIPRTVAHAIWTVEHLPKDIECFYEADTYPHNRFYSSAAQLTSLMTGALMAGSQDFQFYCLQYLDDPLEDRGYVDAYLKLKSRFERVKRFIRERHARLAGVRQVWKVEDLSLTRGLGYGHGMAAMEWMSYFCAKFGLPYTTQTRGAEMAMLVDGTADALTDDEIRTLLSGGLFLDARAAEILARRGFAEHLGVEVVSGKRPPALGEEILPAAGCACAGKLMNCYFIFSAGSEGSVERFVTLKPRAGTETLCRYTGLGGKILAPSVTYATNALGGRVAVMASSLPRNRTSGLYNFRKQELLQNLFMKLADGKLPVRAVGQPGIWLLANVSDDGREMLFMADNLSGDVRDKVDLAFAPAWHGARIRRLDESGADVDLGTVGGIWRVPVSLGSMLPEFFLLRKPAEKN